MTATVKWSSSALHDLQIVFAFIAQDNVKNAHLVADRIENTVELLAVTPFGRPGRMAKTYEAIVPKTPFIVVYSLGGEGALDIVRVIHGARDWKGGEWPE
jgi:toxin ParE1/3/4